MGVVGLYLVKLINVIVNVFDHHCQTCVSECHSDDEFCIGQEERLFMKQNLNCAPIANATINFTKCTSVRP